MKYTQLIILFLLLSSCISSRKEYDENSTINRLSKEADSLYNQDKFELAIMKFDSLIVLEPENGNYFFKKGYSHSMLLQYESANKAYLIAAELSFRPGDAYFNAGVNESLNLRDSLAIIYFNKSLEFKPQDTSAIYELEQAKTRIQAVDSLMDRYKE